MTEKLKMQTKDMANENFEKLAALFPNCVTESVDKDGNPVRAIDKDLLAQEINGVVVEGQKERYQFNWPGKRDAIRTANAPTTMTLRPCKEESVDFDNTQNLYIEGDNLEVLKLLQNNYLGKVKMIYIDPPYNTGNDFVYNDDFKQDSETFLETSGMFDEDGNMTLQNFEKNSESNGRFHTDWLNMMYPRLKIARNLLRKDGLIFISIDNNEIENLRKICDEIFGERNFLNQIVWVNKPEGRQINGAGAAGTHEYILCYAKDATYQSDFSASAEWLKKLMPSSYKGFGFDVKHDAKGAYIATHELHNGNSKFNEETRPSLVFDIYYREGDGDIKIETTSNNHVHAGYTKIPPHANADGIHKYHAYRWSKAKILAEKENLEFIPCDGIFKILTKRRNFDMTTIRDLITDINTTTGSKDLKELDVKGFSYPKPVALISLLLKIVTTACDGEDECKTDEFNKEENIVLDFFSGSCTTAQAVMELNAENGGNMRFICVQLPEETPEGSEARIAGFTNICEIGKERIRRAGKKIKDETGLTAQNLDIGFRVLKLAESNMNDVYYKPADINQGFLDKLESNIKKDRTPMDLLFQVMLECDLPLSSKIEERQINGKQVFFVNGKELVACFDEKIDEATITEIAKQKPYYFIMRDSSLATDNVADNFEQLFNAYSKDTIRKVL